MLRLFLCQNFTTLFYIVTFSYFSSSVFLFLTALSSLCIFFGKCEKKKIWSNAFSISVLKKNVCKGIYHYCIQMILAGKLKEKPKKGDEGRRRVLVESFDKFVCLDRSLVIVCCDVHSRPSLTHLEISQHLAF